MSNIYVIINESLPKGSNLVLTEIVPPARWTYQEALDDLADIAYDNGVEVDAEDSSVYVPVKGTHLETDEYYIIELEVTDRG